MESHELLIFLYEAHKLGYPMILEPNKAMDELILLGKAERTGTVRGTDVSKYEITDTGIREVLEIKGTFYGGTC